MTWKEFKDRCEGAGIKDDSVIHLLLNENHDFVSDVTIQQLGFRRHLNKNEFVIGRQ